MAQLKEVGNGIQENKAKNKGRLLRAIQACSRSKDLRKAREIHYDATASGAVQDICVARSLIAMYANCRSMADARAVFDAAMLCRKDAVAWNALMLGFAENDQAEAALGLYESMAAHSLSANDRTYVAAIKACASLALKEKGTEADDGKLVKLQALQKGISIHDQAVKDCCSQDIFVASCLVDMYAKCGSTSDARQVFDSMKQHNVVTWNSLLLGYVDNAQAEVSLELYGQMQKEPCSANARTLVALLKACSHLAAKQSAAEIQVGRILERGMAIHAQAARRGWDTSDIYVASVLVDMYSKCRSMVDARTVFEKMMMPLRDVVSWTALVLGYADNGECRNALEAFAGMVREVRKADPRVLVAGFKACSCFADHEERNVELDVKLKSLETGMALHSNAIKWKCESNLFVANSLIDMYSRCGSVEDARRVFDAMPVRDSVSWNAMLLGYVCNRESCGGSTLQLLAEMQLQRVLGDGHTIAAALKALASLASQEERSGDTGVRLGCLERGMIVESLAEEAGCFSSDKFRCVRLNGLLEVYAKCGSMFDAQRAFDRMDVKSSSAWNLMMAGRLEMGENEQVLQLFEEMKLEEDDCEPDRRTYTTVLKACACLAALETGKSIHQEVCRRGIVESDRDGAGVVTCLVDLYSKCGNNTAAEVLFDSAATRSVTTWNVLMAGFSREGDFGAVVRVLEEMIEGGEFQPNCVTCLSVLAACRHAGLVEQGKKFFSVMEGKYGVIPQLEHFHSMVDLLGRANRLRDAVELVQGMPYRQNVVTWTTILNACLMWRDVEVGRIAFEALNEMEEKNAATYVLMASIYESVGMLEESRVVELSMPKI